MSDDVCSFFFLYKKMGCLCTPTQSLPPELGSALKVNFMSDLLTMWCSKLWVMSFAIILFAPSLHASENRKGDDTDIKSSVYHSPPFFLRPGSVVDKYFLDIPFPRGYVALKSFHAEVVDDTGIPVPLHETYLHHWLVERYYGPKGSIFPSERKAREFDFSKILWAGNAGICKGTLGQDFGLGSETRKTATWVPEPYGIVIGNPEEIPDGYEESWMLNVHAIDTRGAVDRFGCTECMCNLYNVTVDAYGHPLRKNYNGGLHCCYDQTQCRVRDNFIGTERKLYLRYTMKWVDFNSSILPVKIYIFDVTDTRGLMNGTTAEDDHRGCKVEYEVKACDTEAKSNGKCVDSKKARVVVPRGGDIVYGVAHQHSGGVGSALYGQDGRALCTSMPTYGHGKEVGDEAGYIVGMSTCYPKPGSVRVVDGEVLTLESNYSSTQQHTGVMGLFYILVAESQQEQDSLLHYSLQVSWLKGIWKYALGFILTGGILAIVVEIHRRRRCKEEGYQSLVSA